MPLYEYECRDCRNRFEVRQRIIDDPITVCPSCGGPTRRVLHAAGIIFKGSGWYITDSRSPDSSSSTTSNDQPSTDTSGTKKDTTTSGTSTDSTSKSTADTTS